jgi:hypothetical protein
VCAERVLSAPRQAGRVGRTAADLTRAGRRLCGSGLYDAPMARSSTSHQEAIAALYRLPLSEFTAAREALVRELRGAGRRDEAQEVHALSKATPAAHAVNLLFVTHAESLADLLAAGKAARSGQHAALRGRGGAGLGDQLSCARGLIDELRRASAASVAGSGQAVSRALLERIGNNLQALAFSGDEEPAKRGWLDKDLEPPGFEVMAGLEVASRAQGHSLRLVPKPPVSTSKAASSSARSAPAEKAPAAKPAGPTLQERREAERRIRQLEAARTAVAQARRLADPLLARARDLREEASTQETEALRAEAAAREARQRADLAERVAGQAETKGDKAAQELERAEAALHQLEEG